MTDHEPLWQTCSREDAPSPPWIALGVSRIQCPFCNTIAWVPTHNALPLPMRQHMAWRAMIHRAGCVVPEREREGAAE
jgi:hypothetical protein